MDADRPVSKYNIFLNIGVEDKFADLDVEVEVYMGGEDDEGGDFEGSDDCGGVDQQPEEGDFDGEAGEEGEEEEFNCEVEDSVGGLDPLYAEICQEDLLETVHELLLDHTNYIQNYNWAK